MEIGKLDKRITFQSPTSASDGAGGINITWTDECTVWGALWPVSASESIRAQTEQVTMEVTHRIRIRYRSGFSAKWRAKFGTRYFDIKSIINFQEQGRWLDIICKEVI
jgi:SPP1 family predicted phage head-tail adaptor